MSRLGEDYGIVRTLPGGEHVVEIYSASADDRRVRAMVAFETHFSLDWVADAEVVSLGVDKCDPFVERFEYVGPK